MQVDYVIVGVGSVGCVMVYCLFEVGKFVIIVEYGGMDVGLFIQMFVVLFYLMNMKFYDWGFQFELELYLGGCCMVILCGKVIGGLLLINGMIYVCGYVKDFDYWVDSGVVGWFYVDVLFYYKWMEYWYDGGYGGDVFWCGIDGLLYVSCGFCKNLLICVFVEVGCQVGYFVIGDYNGEQ